MNLMFVLVLTIKISIVFAIALVWGRVFDGARASTRHAVWATAIVVMLLLPLFSLTGSKIEIPIALGGMGESEPVSEAASEPIVGHAMSGRTVDPFVREQGTAREIPWAGIALGVYLAGLLAVLTQFAVGMRRATGVARRAVPMELHDEWSVAMKGLERPRAYRNVAVLASSEIGAPLTFGLINPVVLVPSDVSGWSAHQRRNALVHEFTHLSRFDWAFQFAGVIACAVHWFNPVVWMSVRRLHLEAERACDERVVQFGASPHDYAEQLVELTRDCAAGVLRTTIAMSRDSFLASRVTAILKYRRVTMRSKLVLTTIAVFVTAGAVLLGPLEPVTAAQYRWDRESEVLPPLMRAARDGDIDDVRRLIDDGADVDGGRSGAGTPLIMAATYGYEAIVQALIDAGADVNKTERGTPRDVMRTPLTAAASEGHTRIVELLLDSRARIDAAPQGDATALMEAAENNHEDTAKLLIERGADVHLRIDGDGNAMIAAARSGNVRIAKMMVAAGADVNAGVPGDGNALIIAVRRGDDRMIDYLLSQGADPTAYVPGDESAIVTAAESGDRELLRRLLDATGD